MPDVERRYLSLTDLEVRRAGGNGRQLVGLAARYDSLSEKLDGGFRETIARGAFSESLRRDPDIRASVDHDTGKIIGRTRAGTLQLSDSDAGLEATISPPDTQAGRDVIASVERGDVTGFSIGFRALDDDWESVNGETRRTVNKAELLDVSVVAFPAYDTTVALRSMERWIAKETAMPKETTTVVEAPEVKPDPVTPEVKVQPEPERRSAPPEPTPTPNLKPSPSPLEWRDVRTGKEVRVLTPEQRFAGRDSDELSLGRAIRAMVVGDWSSAPAEHRALSTTANPTAGILVPNALAANVIDLARAKSVLVQAGAKTVAMPSGTLKIARVSEDPTVEVHTENVAFTGSDVTFDGIELVAYTIGVLVKMSRELAADAPNAVSIIENTIAKALAAKLDWYGLRGTGSAMPTGLLLFAGVNTEAVGGSVDWDNVLTALAANETDNHESNAFVGSPANFAVLRALKVNAEANHYATAPPAAQALKHFSTSAMPDSDMFLGDFRQFLIGLRQSPIIEISTEGGSSFEEHAVYIKATFRGAFAAEHDNAFCILNTIS